MVDTSKRPDTKKMVLDIVSTQVKICDAKVETLESVIKLVENNPDRVDLILSSLKTRINVERGYLEEREDKYNELYQDYMFGEVENG